MPRLALAVLAVLAAACSRERRAPLPEGTPARVVLEAEVAGPPEVVRDVWSSRMKAALEGGFLPLRSARADIQGQRLVLEAELVADGPCTPDKAQALARKLEQTATRSGRLGIHRVRIEDAELLERQLRDALPDAARVSTPRDLPGAIVVHGAGELDVLTLARGMVPPGLSLFKEVAEPGQDKVNLRMWLVEEAPALDGRLVTRAWIDDTETGAPGVRVTLSDLGARTFADLTNEVLKQPLPIVFEDEVVAAPLVVGRIETGNLQIALPPGRRDVALAIAAVLTSGGLREAPKVVRLEASCLP
ncbi:MAG: hypothetical protein IT385_12455 [Deltaproteobacteria bacterium]|nr:hypothetical protein [Deltaproteobacteria bacterium]